MAVEMRIADARNDDQEQSPLATAINELEAAINAIPEDLQSDAVQAGARLIARFAQDLANPASSPAQRDAVPAVVSALAGGATPTIDQQIRQEADLLKRSFAWRRAMLESTLSNTEVARLLGVTRQTPHDRVMHNTLVAIKDYRGTNRYPIWQFDPDGPGGVLDGLPEVLAALAVSPIEQVGWLCRANAMLDDETPVAALKRGQRDTVVALAHAVGIH